jgi:putative transposase
MHRERKIIRLAQPKYYGRNIYFLTFCCEGRQPVFHDSSLASSIVSTLKNVSESTAFLVHGYCFMPDHFHLVIEGAHDESDLVHFAKTLKQLTAFRYKQETGQRLWQRRYYDHILRTNDSLDQVLWYVWLNPVRANLCTDARSYPYSGSFTLDWNIRFKPKRSGFPRGRTRFHRTPRVRWFRRDNLQVVFRLCLVVFCLEPDFVACRRFSFFAAG